MEHDEPHEPDPQTSDPEPEPAGGADDALRRLEARLDRASDAAERLIAETAKASAASAGRLAESAARVARAAGAAGESSASADDRDANAKPPPAGWQMPSVEERPELNVLAQLVQSLRELIPPDLQRRLAEALRELLLALRALIDWYLERIEKRRAEPAQMQDIPIL